MLVHRRLLEALIEALCVVGALLQQPIQSLVELTHALRQSAMQRNDHEVVDWAAAKIERPKRR